MSVSNVKLKKKCDSKKCRSKM